MAGLSGLAVFLMVFSYALSPAWIQRASASGYAPFLQTSFWNTPLPRYPQLQDNAASIAQSVAASSSSTFLDVTTMAATRYEVDMSVPTTSVIPVDCGGGIDNSLAERWQAVPIPYYAQPSSGGRMVIQQPLSQTIWEFGGLQKVSGQWQACRGGRIDSARSSFGVFPGTQGITESGLAYMGGSITISDLQRGIIGHAIGISVSSVSGATNWPAVRGGNGSGSVPMGTRLQLDPNIDVTALGLPPIARDIAVAAQKYGFVVWDLAPALTITAESAASYVARGLADPYATLGTTSLAGFPWDKLRALPPEYGRYGMTPSISSFSASTSKASPGQQIYFSWQTVNVDGCTIPGVTDNVAAIGATTAHDIKADTHYTLLCSGPGGSTSSSIRVELSQKPQTDSRPTYTTTTITLPLRESTTILPYFDTEEARQTVQKVTYYERGNYLASSATPPFSLDTARMSDGKHSLRVLVYFHDSHVAEHVVEVRIQNTATQLNVSTPHYRADSLRSLGIPSALMLFVALLGIMFVGVWFGWNKMRPMGYRHGRHLITFVQ